MTADEAPLLWDDGLTPEQRSAASGLLSAQRLLAGPGTGKTFVLTRRVLYLAQVDGVAPDEILALTFTRAATFELRDRIRAGLGEGRGVARVQTLHSFALRQLLRNWNRVRDFPEPLRIADDWEMRWIIVEDLKHLLDAGANVKEVQQKFKRLAADWETLDADQTNWLQEFPDPVFLGAWDEHRKVFGYVLADELVYRVKRALEQLGPEFELERPSSHLLVDEYQDLNRCDLAIIHALVEKGARPYVAGDDDQSIYGFRHAHPIGIREFPTEFAPVEEKQLTVCKRCDRRILALGLFVAGQDYAREPKEIEPQEGCGDGEVRILRFSNQFEEADGVAKVAAHLLDTTDYQPQDLLILLRSDKNRVYSKLLAASLSAIGIDAATDTGDTPLDDDVGRRVLALLRLALNPDDHLALRTLLQLTPGIGGATIRAVYDLSRTQSGSFAAAVRAIVANPQSIGVGAAKVVAAAQEAWDCAARTAASMEELEVVPSTEQLSEKLRALVESVSSDEAVSDELLAYLQNVIDASEADTLPGLFLGLQSRGDDAEQLIERGKVNILTMHKAKGLTAEAVFVVGAEDEQVPGRNESEPEVGDERRLLYVSLTRAKHHLFVTYCLRRTRDQQFYGRNASGLRNLTRFLAHGPAHVEVGSDYIASL